VCLFLLQSGIVLGVICAKAQDFKLGLQCAEQDMKTTFRSKKLSGMRSCEAEWALAPGLVEGICESQPFGITTYSFQLALMSYATTLRQQLVTGIAVPMGGVPVQQENAAQLLQVRMLSDEKDIMVELFVQIRIVCCGTSVKIHSSGVVLSIISRP